MTVEHNAFPLAFPQFTRRRKLMISSRALEAS